MLAISMVCTSIPSLATENTADTSVSADDTVKEITQNESDIQDTDIVFDEYSNTDTDMTNTHTILTKTYRSIQP